MAYDFTTPTGQIRLLIADTDEVNPVLDDNALTGFLMLHGATGDGATPATLHRAAADALEAIAVSEALIGKKIQQADGTATDGTAVAAELRNLAASYRDRADELDRWSDDGGFAIVDFNDPHDWSDL